MREGKGRGRERRGTGGVCVIGVGGIDAPVMCHFCEKYGLDQHIYFV